MHSYYSQKLCNTFIDEEQLWIRDYFHYDSNLEIIEKMRKKTICVLMSPN